jgi:hypothetical protein
MYKCFSQISRVVHFHHFVSKGQFLCTTRYRQGDVKGGNREPQFFKVEDHNQNIHHREKDCCLMTIRTAFYVRDNEEFQCLFPFSCASSSKICLFLITADGINNPTSDARSLIAKLHFQLRQLVKDY